MSFSSSFVDNDSDTSDDFDLGLGHGLRPGSLPPPPSPPPESASISACSSSVVDLSPGSILSSWSDAEVQTHSSVDNPTSGIEKSKSRQRQTSVGARMSDIFGRLSGRLRLKQTGNVSKTDITSDSQSWSFGNDDMDEAQNSSVQLGTTLKEQKQLFELELAEIKRRRRVEFNGRCLSKSCEHFFS